MKHAIGSDHVSTCITSATSLGEQWIGGLKSQNRMLRAGDNLSLETKSVGGLFKHSRA